MKRAVISILSVFLTVLFVACHSDVHPLLWEYESYLYPVYNTEGDPESGIKEWKTGRVKDFTLVTSSDTQWGGDSDTESWYVVSGDVTINHTVQCVGDVNLILLDGSTLTVESHDTKYDYYYQGKSSYHAGIGVSPSDSFSVYSQSTGECCGKLIAKSLGFGAGIGGGFVCRSGKITINGGIIEASGGSGAGIGGGQYAENDEFNTTGNEIVIINGGKITASTVINCAIGNNCPGNSTKIIINGGTVNASGSGSSGDYCAGIGGKSDYILINDGIIDAKGGEYCSAICGSTIKICNGTITAEGGLEGAGIGGGSSMSAQIYIDGGNITAIGGCGAAGIGCGFDTIGSTIEINGGKITAQSGGARGVATNRSLPSCIGPGDSHWTWDDKNMKFDDKNMKFDDICIAGNLVVKAGTSEKDCEVIPNLAEKIKDCYKLYDYQSSVPYCQIL